MFAEQMLPRARERLATIGGAALVKDAAELMSKPHTDIVGQITRCIGGGCIARWTRS